MSKDWDWKNAVYMARQLAQAAEKSETPEQHVKGLAKAIRDLCDAVEDLAEKCGVSPD